MMEYNMAGGPLLPPQEETISSALMAPSAYEPVYSQEKMRNPRREFWGNMLIDMGNMFGSWNGNQFTRPMTGAGFQAKAQAQSANERMMAANRTAQRQYQQDYNQYQRAVPQLAATNLALGQAQEADALGINPNMPATYQQYMLAQQSGFQGSYNDFLQQQARLGIGDRRTANRKDYEFAMSLPPGQRQEFLNRYVDPAARDDRYGTFTRPGPNGSTEIYDPDQGTYIEATPDAVDRITQSGGRSEGRVQRFKQGQVSIGEQNDIFETELDTKVPQIQKQLDDARQLANDMRAGKYNETGMLEGLWKGKTTREGAQLQAKQVMSALNNLQIVNLAPVTENEIAMIERLYASIGNDPEANIGILDQIAQRAENILREYARAEQYYRTNGNSIRGYGRQQLQQYAPGTDAEGGQVQVPAGTQVPGARPGEQPQYNTAGTTLIMD